MYVTNEELATRLFIRAKNKTLLTVEKPSAFQVYVSLVGTYYAYNLEYQPVSKEFFELLDFCILDKDAQTKSGILKKLKAEYKENEKTFV